MGVVLSEFGYDYLACLTYKKQSSGCKQYQFFWLFFNVCHALFSLSFRQPAVCFISLPLIHVIATSQIEGIYRLFLG